MPSQLRWLYQGEHNFFVTTKMWYTRLFEWHHMQERFHFFTLYLLVFVKCSASVLFTVLLLWHSRYSNKVSKLHGLIFPLFSLWLLVSGHAIVCFHLTSVVLILFFFFFFFFFLQNYTRTTFFNSRGVFNANSRSTGHVYSTRNMIFLILFWGEYFVVFPVVSCSFFYEQGLGSMTET